MSRYNVSPILGMSIKKTINDLIKKQEELKHSEEKYKRVVEATRDIIWEGDLVKRKRYFSGKLQEILGYSAEELEDLDKWFHIVHPDDLHLVKKHIEVQIDEKIEVESVAYRVKGKDGNVKWLLSNTKCEFDENDKAVTAYGAFTDITIYKEQEKKIHKLAYYDSVTGLPNRVMLSEKVKSIIENKDSSEFSMIFIDLDNFKFVNDSYGHLVGDQLLIEVGKRLREVQDERIMTFRLGGDEFIVLMENIKDKEEVKQFSINLNRILANAIFIEGHMFYVNYSSGIVLYPKDGDSYDELLKNADTAMYKSKELGKGIYSFYDVKMGEEANEKAKIQAYLHKAIEKNEFKLYYQPIVDITEGRIKGCEALIRWFHPEHGMISPDKFIGIAEENGTIIEIGKWVFENACKYAKKIYDNGNKDFYVSMNVSPRQLLEEHFTDFIINTIKKVNIVPELIVIEITESALIESMDLAINKLNILRQYGVKVALDDFGCGYSSLTYLKQLPINILKVDRSFISDIQSEEDTKNLTSIIILLAKQLGLSVIAEGVEEKYHLDYLKKYSCDMFQGYYKSKPVPEEEITKLMNIN